MRGEPGRGGAGRGMLLGVGRWPIPCELENGLLPGRGWLGRWPMPWLDEKGLLPGRGAPGRGMLPPGRGPEDAFTASDAPSAGLPAFGSASGVLWAAAFSAAAFSAAAFSAAA